MDMLADPKFKLKYQKCKYKVKTWEKNFKKSYGRNPCKTDIKNAEQYVREAYKTYYNLKSIMLQDSLMDLTFNDEPENSENIQVNDKSIKSPDISSEKVRNTLSDIPNDKNEATDHTKLNECTRESTVNEEISKEKQIGLTENIKGVWGSHLNKSGTTSSSSKKLTLQRSFSSSFAEKLFVGSKFNKRNPRKALSFSRSKSENKTNPQTSSLEPESQEIIPHTSNSTDIVDVEPIEDENDLDVIDNKIRIVTKAIPVKSQVLSVIQKSLSDDKPLAAKRKLDKGWVDRCSRFSNLDKLASIVDSQDEVIPKQAVNTDSNVVFPPTPTSESDTQSEILEKSLSETSNSLLFQKKEATCGQEIIINSDEDLVYSSESEHEDNSKNQKYVYSRKRKFDISVDGKDGTSNSIAKRLKTSPTRVGEVVCSQPDFTNLIESKVKTLSNISAEVADKASVKSQPLTKREIFEKKLSTGQANENFVRINLKKKVYVRGKKTLNFQKYKKMQWKKKKAIATDLDDVGSGGIRKCFSCGDIGHFARNCKSKGDKLLPQDESEDESPFPTLEEIAAMAQESNNQQKLIVNDSAKNEASSAEILGSAIPTDVIDALQQDEVKCKIMDPVYPLQEDGSLIDTPLEVYDALGQFGHSSFRWGQEEAIMRILSGMSTLVTLSTGAGKSLCYQLPAYIYAKRKPCITIVVSPLVSLMEDQVGQVASCIKIACIHTNQSPKQREKVIDLAKSGKLQVLLVSPESVAAGEKSSGLGSFFKELPPIAFVCIDEAHCISQWSHNFRPSYLMISKVIREKFGVKTILGLTATATKQTCDSIIDQLKIPNDDKSVIKDIPLPNNLVLSVSKDENRDQALISLLQNGRLASCTSVIVYCTRREECSRLATLIRTFLQDRTKPEDSSKRVRVSWNAEAYHAGLSAYRRKLVQNSFMSGKLRIVVATVAFGMGINKQDIRGVIHYNMPRNFESYVQEVGRAGRDGLPAYCHIFLDTNGGDKNELRRHIYANSVERHTIRKLLQKVFFPCQCPVNNVENAVQLPTVDVNSSSITNKTACEGHEVSFSVEETVQALDLPEENILTLLCYLELHPKKWITVLPRVYTVCEVLSYKGPQLIKSSAKKCPPLAMAIALDQRRGISHEKSTKIEFPIVDIAATLDWDSGIAKRQLKDLEWSRVNDKWKRTGITVNFSNLGFHLKAPGNLEANELDEALDTLCQRVQNQEMTALHQLDCAFDAFNRVAYTSCLDFCDATDQEKSDTLKSIIRNYFTQEVLIPKEIENVESEFPDEQLATEIRQILCSYPDTNFTGRAIARIFHGISSPCFPAQTWFRCRSWRTRLNVSFKHICKLAAKEILRMK